MAGPDCDGGGVGSLVGRAAASVPVEAIVQVYVA
jgi:hypothetical protein